MLTSSSNHRVFYEGDKGRKRTQLEMLVETHDTVANRPTTTIELSKRSRTERKMFEATKAVPYSSTKQGSLHACTYCGKSFTQKFTLRRHVASFHNTPAPQGTVGHFLNLAHISFFKNIEPGS